LVKPWLALVEPRLVLVETWLILVEPRLVLVESLLGETGSSSCNSDAGTNVGVVEDLLGGNGGLGNVFSNVLFNAFYKRGGYLTMYHGLDLFGDHGPDGLLDNGLQVDNTGAGIGEGLVGVLLDHTDLRGINLTMYDGLYLNNLLRTGGLHNHGGVDVGHNVGLGLELSALV